MALIDQIDKLACGSSGTLGTGTEACPIDWDRISTLKLTPKNQFYTEEDNLESVQAAQQTGKTIIINNIDSFVLVPQEVVYDTTEGSGKKSVSGELPYEYNLMFKNQGKNFWKAMRSYDSQGNYDVTFYDVDGNEFFTETKAGKAKGFATYLIKTGQYKGKEGSTPAQFMTTIQLSDYKEMERMRFISSDELDYSAQSDLAGVNEVKVNVDPISAGTSIALSAFLLDGTHAVEGLLFGNFTATKNGATSNPTAAVYNSATKKYTLTVSTLVATDVVTVSLNGIILTTLGTLYKSNTAMAVVI